MPASVVGAVQAEVRRAFAAAALPPGGLVIVAVSGGADSSCLLHACSMVLPALGSRVAALHVDHGLRGAASSADARAVSVLAAELGVPLEVVRVDVAAAAKRRRHGLEEAGRHARYAALAARAAAEGAWGAVTGHTQDDQVETVLINLLRGTGPTGLRGMSACQSFDRSSPGLGGIDWPESSSPALRVLRPLLTVPRARTTAYCLELGLSWRFDESNLDPTFLRNRIRHQLVPLLRTYNSAIDEHLLGLAALSADDELELDRGTTRVWTELEVEAERVRISWPFWRACSASLQRRLLRRAAAHLTEVGLSLRAVESARLLLATGLPNRRLRLAGGLRLGSSRAGFELRRLERVEQIGSG